MVLPASRKPRTKNEEPIHMQRTLLLLLSLLLPLLSPAQVIIRGVVTDITSNEPLAGAFVTVKGINNAAVADESGMYELLTPSVNEPVFISLAADHLGFKERVEKLQILPVDDGKVLIKNLGLEPDPLTIKNVTITANKVEEELQAVPIAATVIDANELTKRTVASTDEAFTSVPNLVTDAFLPSRATFSLRGLASDFTNVGIENSVGLYIDDVYYSRSYNFNSSLFDIERIEVLRGPQGTLFGKNTIGGVLHVISEKPKMGNLASAELNVGNYGYFQFRGKANSQLVKDKLALRLSGAFRRRNGWQSQQEPIVADQNGVNFSGFRVALLYRPFENLEVELKGFRSQDDKADFTEEYQTPKVGVDLLAVNENELDQQDRQSASNEPNRKFDRSSYGAIGRVSAKLGRRHTLTSITALTGFDSKYARDLDATSVDAVYTDNATNLNNFSQEIRISTPRENQKFFYLAGLYFLSEELENQDSLAFKRGMERVWKIFFQNPGLEMPGYFESASLSGRIDASSFAAFVSSSLEISERVRLNGGLRFTREEKNIDFIQTPYSEFGIVQELAATPVGKPGDPLRRSVTDRVVTGNFGMDFQTSDNTLLYFNFARGFKGSGFNLSFTPDVNVEKVAFQFEPEFLNSYEVGIKLKSSNRFRWNAAVFVTDFKNKQEVLTAGSSVFVANAQSIQGQGFEAEFTGIWTKFLRTDMSLGLLNLRYLNFPFIDPLTLEERQLSGNRALKAPGYTFKLAPEFHWPLNNSLKLLVRLDYDLVGKAYNDIFNTESLARQAVGMLSGRVSVSTIDERLSLSLWGKNLTDAVYFQHGWQYTWGEVVAVNPPRMFGLELRANFY